MGDDGSAVAAAAIMGESLPVKFLLSSRCCFLRKYRRSTNTSDSIHVSVTIPSTTTRAIAHVGKPFPPLDCDALFWSAVDRNAMDSSDESDCEIEFMA